MGGWSAWLVQYFVVLVRMWLCMCGCVCVVVHVILSTCQGWACAAHTHTLQHPHTTHTLTHTPNTPQPPTPPKKTLAGKCASATRIASSHIRAPLYIPSAKSALCALRNHDSAAEYSPEAAALEPLASYTNVRRVGLADSVATRRASSTALTCE